MFPVTLPKQPNLICYAGFLIFVGVVEVLAIILSGGNKCNNHYQVSSQMMLRYFRLGQVRLASLAVRHCQSTGEILMTGTKECN